MSIVDTFDCYGEEIISAKSNVRMIENFPAIVLVVFSAKLCKLFLNKYDDAIKLENMHTNYKFRSELSKSNKFYSNEFNTNVSYDALMDFKKELM